MTGADHRTGAGAPLGPAQGFCFGVTTAGFQVEGSYAVDRARGNRWSDTDAMGHDSAGAYRHIIEGLRVGDRTVLTAGTSR